MDTGIKVYFVESTDPYRDVSIVGNKGFFDESQADALEKECEEKLGKIYSFLGQEIWVQLSHRNGETANPEVDGYYFVECLDTWTIEFNPCQSADPEITLSHFYGPIPMPEKLP